MPITVVKDLPAIAKLAEENIFVMDTVRAETQDIRPLQILIVNLMPTKRNNGNTDFKSIKQYAVTIGHHLTSYGEPQGGAYIGTSPQFVLSDLR